MQFTFIYDDGHGGEYECLARCEGHEVFEVETIGWDPRDLRVLKVIYDQAAEILADKLVII